MKNLYAWRKEAEEVLDPDPKYGVDYVRSGIIAALARIEYAESQYEAFKWSLRDVFSNARDRGQEVEWNRLNEALLAAVNEAYRDYFMWSHVSANEEDHEKARELAYRRFLSDRYDMRHWERTCTAWGSTMWNTRTSDEMRASVHKAMGKDPEKIDFSRELQLEEKLDQAVGTIQQLVEQCEELRRSERKMREQYEAVVGAFTEEVGDAVAS